MSKFPKAKNTIYKSFEQFKAELFPESRSRSEARSNQNVHDLAICLAETSFNEVLRTEKKA
jgi:hypothetical protein